MDPPVATGRPLKAHQPKLPVPDTVTSIERNPVDRRGIAKVDRPTLPTMTPGESRAVSDLGSGGFMRRKTFRPVLDPMEPRIALSGGWFSDFVDSLFGKSTTDDDKPQ